MSTTAQQSERPPDLIYAVNEWPPPARLAMLGFQYAVMDAMYLVLVVIIVRHAHVSRAVGVNLMGVACIGLAIGAVLQSLPRGPVGSGLLSLFFRLGMRQIASIAWDDSDGAIAAAIEEAQPGICQRYLARTLQSVVNWMMKRRPPTSECAISSNR